MKLIVEEIDSYVEGIKISCTPVETLVLNHAMQVFANNEEIHIMDRDVMKRMLKDFAEGIVSITHDPKGLGLAKARID